MSGLVPFNRNRGLFSNRFSDFDNVLDDFFGDFLPAKFFESDTFKIDVGENDKTYFVEAELPGFKKEDICLELCEGKLTISAEKEQKSEEKKNNYIHRERRFGKMQRSVYLKDVSDENVDAVFENGILKITLEKLTKKESSKRIDVK